MHESEFPTYGAILLASGNLSPEDVGAVVHPALLSPGAEVVGVGHYLQASAQAYTAVGVDPTQGTRHASATRFSFDTSDAVVFVVSHDGPVTVYFKGSVVASIRSRPEEEVSDGTAASGSGTARGAAPCRRHAARSRSGTIVSNGWRLRKRADPRPTTRRA